MAVELYDAGNGDGLFDLIGKAIHAFNTLNTARLTTIPTQTLAVLTKFENLASPSIAQQNSIVGIAPATFQWQGGGSSLAAALQQYCQQYLIETVHADTKLSTKNLQTALKELIRQMIASSDSMDANTVSAAITVGSSNTGTGVVTASVKRGDGLTQEHALVETLTLTVETDTNANSTITIIGTSPEDMLSQDWPRGSGAAGSITATTPGSSLVSNGDFELEDDIANAPDDWIISVGTIGTTIKMSNVEVQTVAISGTPASGTYLLTWTNLDGKVQSTAPIAWNAGASDVQAALNALKGLESVTVTATGTSPDYTHSVTFTNAGGNQTILASTNRLNTGSITHGTTTAGDSQVYSGGKSLQIVGDGAQLTTLNQKINGLKPETVYAVNLFAVSDTTPAAGVVTIDLVDGIGGTVLADKQAANNTAAFNASALGTGSTWKDLKTLVGSYVFFRTPTVIPDNVYLRLRVSTAITNTRVMTVDNLCMVEARAAYTGGPFIAAFAGSKNFKAKDTWAVAISNDRAGTLHEGCARMFGMAGLDLLFPVNASAGETVPDTVVG